MARRGRKRNATAERYPSGEVVHSREDQSVVAKLARANSLREMLNEIGRPEYATEFWRLFAKGAILETHKRAGDAWSELVASHRRIVLDAPSASPKAASMERAGKGKPVEYDDALAERIAKQYDAAFCVVADAPEGLNSMKAINALVLEDEHLTHDRLLLAKAGLSRLAVHFGFL